MKISEQKVRYVAGLANLELTDDEIRRMRAELEEILVYVDKLNEVDTSDVQPMAQVLYDAGETATLRDDMERPTLGGQTALANAPLATAGYFKVPLVIEK